MQMRVLVTGSSGQIGTNLALRLLAEGHAVVGVDIRANPWTEDVRTQVVDLRLGPGPLQDAVADEGIEVVVHLAAHAKVYELVEHPERALENIDMTFAALELARVRQVPFVFGSSREVYGEIVKIREEQATDESDADFMAAESPYSASKIAGEALMASYGHCYGLPYVVFRFSNVYGRYDNDLERLERVVPLFIERLRRGEPITIFGKEKVLDFTYVDDCVDAMLLAAESEKANGRIFNLGSDCVISLKDLAEMLIEVNGSGKYIIRTFPEDRKKIDIGDYYSDDALIRDTLGWEHKVPLKKALMRIVEYYRKHLKHYI